ncbi:hypothetical protein HPB52_007065 [Rhipicephalus sanguineus]|uniref:Pancreatic trypsin inhibitor n=1 Tax=Rhipicephalus sanguineus TaxID=34632 RepID=A0A9D4T3Z3_RHISA|nr:hypothetical protein HPB52_007065 [Rhipicephalus sanguineus]
MRAASIGCGAFSVITLVTLIAIAIIVAMVSPSPRHGFKPPSGKVVVRKATTELAVNETNTENLQDEPSETHAPTTRYALYVTPRNRRHCRAPHLVDCSSEAARNLSGLVRHHAWFFMPDESVAGGGTCLEWIQGHMCHDYSRNRFRSHSACREACENGIPRLKCTRRLDLQSVYDCTHSDSAGVPPRRRNATRRAETPRVETLPALQEASSSEAEEATTPQEAPRPAHLSGSKSPIPKAGTTPKLASKPEEPHTVWQWWFYDPLLHACRYWKDVCVFRGYATMAECAKACVFK